MRRWLTPLVLAVAALVLTLICHAHHVHAIPQIALIAAGTLLLFGLCGDALCVALVPSQWRAVRPLLTLPLGAAASGMVLMAFGVAHVPLKVSLWLTLALGLAASVWMRRRAAGGRSSNSARRDVDAGSSTVGVVDDGGASGWMDTRGPWIAVLTLVFLIALIPAWRTGDLTIYGENPDSSQVVGIAVLFQHVPPTHYDVSLPLDIVPPEWRFRYPIFYPLAAVSNLVHVDPITAFSVLAALLGVMTALGWGLTAVRCFRAPEWAGPAIAGLIGLTWIVQYLVWHPYWNQLWGTALMPFAILFGWHALERREGASAIACVVMLAMLWFAYPLALPYPLVILAGVLVAYWQRPRRWLPRPRGWRGWAATVVMLALLIPAVAGSALKLKQAISQLLTPNSTLWGGDVKQYLSLGNFAGTGGGVTAGVLVLVVAAYGLWRLPARLRVCFGAVLAALLALDLRFRLSATGTYMDFKHLSFMGLMVLTLAASGVFARATAPGAGRWLAALLVVVWGVAAVRFDRLDAITQNEQVTPEMFQIRAWAAKLPAGASVRVDIPPYEGGLQVWAVYMLGSHPVDSFEPVLGTTYAHAIPGFRADYSLSLSIWPGTLDTPFPPVKFTLNPPVSENTQFVLRKVDWPKRDDNVAQTASQVLVEP